MNLRSRFVRLAIILTVLPVLILTGIGGLSHALVKDQLSAEIQRRISDEIATFAETYAQDGLSGIEGLIASRNAMIPSQSDRLSYQVYDAETPREGSAPAEEAQFTAGGFKETGELIFRRTPLSPQVDLLVSSTTQSRDRSLKTIRNIFLLAIASCFLMSLIIGTLTSRGLSRRLASMSDTIDRVATGHVEARIAPDHAGDEITGLSTRINAMLDRVERLLGLRKQVADQVAHEVRTPLTRMETALADAAATARNPEAIETARAQIAASVAMLDGLLDISALEAQQGDKIGFSKFNLSDRVAVLCDFYQALAEEKDQILTLSLDKTAIIQGDEAQIDRLIGNLLSNAIKYTPHGGSIHVATEKDQGGTRLRIEDSGPGISAERRDDAFKPFFRLRTHPDQSGHGLGLALVKAIADRHNAHIAMGPSKFTTGMGIDITF